MENTKTIIAKLTPKLESDIRLYLPKILYNLIFKELTILQRNQIDWYILKQAVKLSNRGKLQEMHLYVANFHREEIRRFKIKSIYHESREWNQKDHNHQNVPRGTF